MPKRNLEGLIIMRNPFSKADKADTEDTMEDRAAKGAEATARRFARRGDREAAQAWRDEAAHWKGRSR